jgi:hypothetical protein
MHHSKQSITQISQALGRNKGTISRELSRNGEGNNYSACQWSTELIYNSQTGLQASVEGYEARKSRTYCQRIGAVLVSRTNYWTSWYETLHRNNISSLEEWPDTNHSSRKAQTAREITQS